MRRRETSWKSRRRQKKDYRIFGIQEYPQLGQLYEYRESRRLVSPDGTSHSLGDLVEERLYRRYSDEVEDLVRGRLEAFASHIIDSINRNASDMLPGGVNREMIDMGLTTSSATSVIRSRAMRANSENLSTKTTNCKTQTSKLLVASRV